MNIEPLISPDEFVGLEGVTHLCTGGEAPWLKAQETVYADFARLKSAGYDGRGEIYARGERCRQRMGQLWGVPSARIAFMPSAAEGMNWLARGLDWQAGDNIVTTNLEFPSVAYAWKHLRSQGVEVRMVPHQNWIVHEEDLLVAVDGRTRVLAVSHVSFYTGQCLNLERLSEGIRGKGALFAVDATHASGVVDVAAGLTDLTVSSSYKWMLATHGVAPCYLSPRAEEQTEATSFGWHNLAVWPAQRAERLPEVVEKPMPERMEPGNPAMLVVMHLDRGLEALLAIGIERIADHARSLSEQVSAGLMELEFTVISPENRAARSGNTCFLVEDAKGMQDRLAERSVLCWGEYGRVRISTHLYNGSADVVRFLEVLSDLK
ncbi:MAG: aminotransferase class V-fold PLP-dependent enzyme [Candidatus Poribacteria bacterium]|nr:aminotransferase class V-fold PLP-dependent enzyme [Candidatus Poribacteria bacterium]